MPLPSITDFSASNHQLHAIAREVEKALDCTDAQVAETIMTKQAVVARELSAAYQARITEILSSADGVKSVADMYSAELGALQVFLAATDLPTAHAALANVARRGH